MRSKGGVTKVMVKYRCSSEMVKKKKIEVIYMELELTCPPLEEPHMRSNTSHGLGDDSGLIDLMIASKRINLERPRIPPPSTLASQFGCLGVERGRTEAE